MGRDTRPLKVPLNPPHKRFTNKSFKLTWSCATNIQSNQMTSHHVAHLTSWTTGHAGRRQNANTWLANCSSLVLHSAQISLTTQTARLWFGRWDRPAAHVIRIGISTVARKPWMGGGLYVCAGGAWHSKIWQKLQCFIVFFNSGGLEAFLGGLSPPKAPPWRRDSSGVVFPES